MRCCYSRISRTLYIAPFILISIFLFASSPSRFVSSYRQISQHKQWYRYPGNPGVKIRITKKGANHIKTVGIQIFNEYISELKDFSTSVPFSQLGLNGIVQLKSLHVKNYHAPHLTVLNFLPPRHIILGLENLDISLGSNFEANSPPIKIEGTLDGSIVGMTIALTTELLVDVNGKMNALVRNCSAVMNRSHVTLNPNGPMAIFVKTFEPIINDSIRQRMPELLCGRLQSMIEKNVAAVFDQITRIDLKDYFPQFDEKEKDVMKTFMHQFSKGMFVDNRMMLQPSVTMEYIETSHLGEVRFDDLNSSYSQIPFYPWPMEYQNGLYNTLNDHDHMAHFFVSDHLLNTMLYHAYQDNRLSIKIDQTNIPAEMSSLMATSCPSKKHPTVVCVGQLIPQIGKTYPNSTASFVILPHGLPYVMFNKDATAVEIANRILTYVEPEESNDNLKNKSQILVFSVNGQADIRFAPTNESLGAKLNLNRFNVRLHRSAVRGVDESSISRLSPLSKTFISPRLNDAIEKSLRFPTEEAMQFINPKISNYDGFIVMSTDFKLDKKRLQKIVKKSLDNIG